MGDYKDAADLHLIIGSPPGYVESEHQGPLFRFAETHPQGVILLEAFDRAHEDVQNFFLRIIAAGEVNDNHGRTISFRGHLFILTTNIPVQSPDPLSDLKLIMNNELLSMVDSIVVFKELDSLVYDSLFSNLLADIKKGFPQKRPLVLKIDDTSRANILVFLSSSNPDIRGFQREFDKKISVPIAKLIQKNAGVSQIVISWENDKIKLTPKLS
jgi:ATP-dependent Clp protease ATP-binding subunit ClpB